MPTAVQSWNPDQKRLNAYLSSSATFARGLELCREMHARLHDLGEAAASPSVYRDLLDGLPAGALTFRRQNKFASIAWNIWHITRIEDAVANVFLAGGECVLDDSWTRKLGTSVRDTGNAFTAEEVDAFSARINGRELLRYREAVGTRTQAILGSLVEADRNRKPTTAQLNRIMEEGVLTRHPESVWLLDFWGRKTVAQLLQMPIARHQIVHLNDCFKLKAACQKLIG